MAKQLNLQLNVQANTAQAVQSLKNLSSSLNQLSTITPAPSLGAKLSQDLQIAKQSAIDLQYHLNNAFNVKTGNLDLSKLQNSLKASNQDLNQLAMNLLKAGSAGQQGFMSLQQSVSTASVQINKANTLLSNFWTTLKNTARWQLSSTLLHGFISGLQSAWSYAKNLDQSLNNIRIVTGYSTEQMTKFAEQANKAAKSLSTTTTQYTNASLIYYQQGLSDAEVAKRTEVTIKMANVTRQSAETVSNQLTAIWNNFYDGSKSLEYYADVITALGAATATSSDEIAGGLEKFAAIGETIGLSYEYAASALATITANTRQSEEVVGTALKTILARIQGLNLGETLEDGTTLNKYSEALSKVGISIFDASGEMKKMDIILDEMGAKWQLLSKDQQVALAQTVAGVRQYAQLVALMDNWNDGTSDSMISNLNTAENAEGTLTGQADIYADSWEAATKRVQAAAQGIYRDLFPTEKMTGLMDGFATFLEGIDGLVQGLGGLKGVLLLISTIVLNVFQNQIGSAIDNLILKVNTNLTNAFYNVSDVMEQRGAGLKGWVSAFGQILGYCGGIYSSTAQISNSVSAVSNNSGDMAKQLQYAETAMNNTKDTSLQYSISLSKSAAQAKVGTTAFQQWNANLMQINNTQYLIEKSYSHLSNAQREQLSNMQLQTQEANNQLLAAKDTLAIEQQRVNNTITFAGSGYRNMDNFIANEDPGKIEYASDLLNTKENQIAVSNIKQLWNDINIEIGVYKGHLTVISDIENDLQGKNKEALQAYSDMKKALLEIAQAKQQNKTGSKEEQIAIKDIIKNLREQEGLTGIIAKRFLLVGGNADRMSNSVENVVKQLQIIVRAMGTTEGELKDIDAIIQNLLNTENQVNQKQEDFNNKIKGTSQYLQQSLNAAISFGNVLTNVARGASTIAMGISSITNAFETFSDENASFTTKLTSGTMALTMGMSGLMTVLGGLNSLLQATRTMVGLNTAANALFTDGVTAQTTETLKNVLVKQMGVKAEEADAIATKITTKIDKGATKETIKNTIANYANVASQAAKLWYITLIIAAIAAITALIVAATTAEDSYTKSLNAAKESLEASNEAYETAIDKVQEFKDTLEGYETAIENIKKLTEGTDEYTDAVEEANKQARKLIETYQLFDKDDYKITADGLIKINEDALDKAKSAMNDYESRAEITKITAQIGYTEALLEKKANDLGKYAMTTVARYEGSDNKMHYVDQTDTENMSQEYLDKMQSGEVEYVTAGLDADDVRDLADAYNEMKEAAGGLAPTQEEFIQAIKENGVQYGISSDVIAGVNYLITNDIYSGLEGFANEVDKATAALEYYTKQLIGEAVGSKYNKAIQTYAQGNEQKAALMESAIASVVSEGTVGDTGLTLDEYVQKNSNFSGVLAVATNNDAANNIENETSDYIAELFGASEGNTTTNGTGGDWWIDQHYSDIFGPQSAGYNGNINTMQMAEDYLNTLGTDVTVTNKNGKIEYTYMNGDELVSGEMSNKAVQENWSRTILNYAVQSNAASQMEGIVTEEQANKAAQDLADTGSFMGVDNWSDVLLQGVANGGQFDFSSIAAEIDFDEYAQLMQMATEDAEGLQEALGLSDETLQLFGVDLAAVFSQGFSGWMKQHTDGLIEIAKNYSNCKDEIQELQYAMNSWDAELIKAASEQLEASIELGKAAEQYELDANALDIQAKQLSKAYGLSAKDGAKLAVQNQRMNKGIDSLISNWGKWKKEIMATDKTTMAYAESVAELSKTMVDLLGISEDFTIPDSFYDSPKVINLIEQAANGSAKAVNLLGAELAKATMQDIAEEDLNKAASIWHEADDEGNFHFNTEAFETSKDNILKGLDEFAKGVENGTLKAGDSIDALGQTWVDDMNKMIQATGMTTSQVQDMLDAMNISATIKEEKRTFEETYPTTVTWTADVGEKDFDGTTYKGTKSFTQTDGFTKATVTKTIPIIQYGDNANNKITYLGSGKGGGTPSGSKGSGGGGSSSKKKKSKEIDRYHEVKKSLENLTKQYDALSKAKERAFGKDKLAYIEKEKQLIQDEINLQKQYLAEIEKNFSADKKTLAGYGATFNEKGEINNYDELIAQYVEKVNNGKITEDEYSEFKDAISQYEETYALWLDENQNLIDKQNELFDKALEGITIDLELKMGVAEDNLEYINYQLENIEDQAYDAAEALALLTASANETMSKSQATTAAIQGLLANHGITDMNSFLANPDAWDDYDFTATEIENLRSWRSELLNNNKELMELKDQALDQVIRAFDEWNEKLDKNISKFDHYSAILDSFQNIIDIIGKDTLGLSDEVLAGLTEAKVQNATNKLDASRAKMEALQKAEAETQAKLMSATTETEKEMLEDTLEHIQEQTDAAEEEMMGNWEEALQAAADAFEQAVDRVISSFEKAMAGTFGSLEDMQGAFDQATEISERYVADYKEIYELSKLNRDITNSIDETDNLKAKRALRDLQKEINNLQNSEVEMSQYDLDHLRAKYELRLAEIALEEAQNAKSQVRMRRDSEGNYSYVFTADQSKIDEAQQNYEDKLYEMQELNSEYIKEMQNNILQSEIELAEALRELDRTKFASDEEYYAKVNELTAYYTGQRNYYLDETNKGITNNQDLVNTDWANYSATTGYKMSADKDYVDSFTETTYAQLAGYESIEDAQNRFAAATKVMVNDLKTAFTAWQQNTESIMSTAGTSLEDFGDTMQTAIYGDGEENNGIVGASDEAAEVTNKLKDAMETTFSQDTLDGLSDFATNYEETIQPVIEANEKMAESLNKVIQAQAEMQGETYTPPDQPPDNGSVEGSNNNGSTTKQNPHGKASDAGSSNKSIQWALQDMGYDIGSAGVDGIIGSATRAAIRKFQSDMGIIVDGSVGSQTRNAFKEKGYKTGGLVDYTGHAWLDGTPSKPEYVLNADQTAGFLNLVNLLENSNRLNQLSKLQERENMLKELSAETALRSFELVNSIARVIDLNAGAQAYGLGTLNAITARESGQVIEQEITIHAEFPTASERGEIEAAFDSLLLRASQFANRKKL